MAAFFLRGIWFDRACHCERSEAGLDLAAVDQRY
jgi:hypothetical protein